MAARISLQIFTFYLSIYCCFVFAIESNKDEIESSLVKRNQQTITSPLATDRDAKMEVFSQILDHFAPKENQQKWKQRYSVNDNAFEDDGLVILVLGGEASIKLSTMYLGIWADWCEKYKCLFFELEHRFYGKSRPTPDLSTDSLQYLTVAQALADTAYFIEIMKKKWSLTKRNKWIVIGGSYSGALAAWMRRNHPELVDGAIASSATFPTKPFCPEYLVSVFAILDTYNSKLTKTIRQATRDLKKIIKRDCTSVLQKFSIKPELDCNNKIQLARFFKVISTIFTKKVQNNEFLIDDFEEIVNEVMTPVDRFASFIKKEFEGTSINLNEMIFKNTFWKPDDLGNRQWSYQQCTELGMIVTSDSNKQPFGHYFDSKIWFDAFCTDIFGPKIHKKTLKKGIQKINEEFGGLDSSFNGTIFTVAEKDPWKSIQMKKNNIKKIKLLRSKELFTVKSWN